MKTVGVIGGMSWESTVTYYQILNEAVARELGALHSAKVLLHSVDFAEVEAAMSAGRWDDVARIVGDAAAGLEAAGADCALCRGVIRDESRQELLRIIDDLRARGAEAVVLGCTEIPLLVSPGDTDLPLLDTTAIHAERAAAWALEG